MSEVALRIGGHTYRVACAPGEEDHVADLGAMIGEKLASMGNLSGQDAQNMLFAALLLADEVHEGRDTVARASGEIAAAQALAGTAAGESDELRAALRNRDAEVEQLQSAQQDLINERDAAHARLAEVSERLTERQANETALQERIEQLTQERDEFANREQSTNSGGAAESDLAPALESLAEMLEQCADKLEGAGQTS